MLDLLCDLLCDLLLLCRSGNASVNLKDEVSRLRAEILRSLDVLSNTLSVGKTCLLLLLLLLLLSLGGCVMFGVCPACSMKISQLPAGGDGTAAQRAQLQVRWGPGRHP